MKPNSKIEKFFSEQKFVHFSSQPIQMRVHWFFAQFYFVFRFFLSTHSNDNECSMSTAHHRRRALDNWLFSIRFFWTKVLPHNLFSIHNKFICFLHYQTIVQPINERIFFSSKSCTSLEAFFFFSGKQIHIQSQS